MSERLRAKLAAIKWGQVVERAALTGLDLQGVDWIGPPNSDAIRASWFPKFPESIEIGAVLYSGGRQRLDDALRAILESKSSIERIICLFGDDMWGAAVVDTSQILIPGTVRKLVDLDGNQVTLVFANSALIVDCTVDNDEGLYELIEILPK